MTYHDGCKAYTSKTNDSDLITRLGGSQFGHCTRTSLNTRLVGDAIFMKRMTAYLNTTSKRSQKLQVILVANQLTDVDERRLPNSTKLGKARLAKEGSSNVRSSSSWKLECLLCAGKVQG